MVKIAPSILSADFSRLTDEVKLAEAGGADMIHIDVMDGIFVPNITIGPVVIRGIRHVTDLPFDVHLMIEKPQNYIDDFASAGADYITVHLESNHDVGETIGRIREKGKKIGLSLNPSTPFNAGERYLDRVDMLLVMTVNPGFAGQEFIMEMVPKIEQARKRIDEIGLPVELQVDGGITEQTAFLAARAGANILVAGSSIYSGDVVENIRKLRESAEKGEIY